MYSRKRKFGEQPSSGLEKQNKKTKNTIISETSALVL